ncbi:LysR family transcriptional regulator [Paenibacillus azoreducens]|uniref:LysR family transcriptional regulator n=1 Tax=Paenibacillus azoreducens TaxID=116718 RepID=A0A919YMV0_9BACL|nr:LysR family transcriptional regulator [Paenibacillus azoreducens]GIO51510.1 LysR family transcriptional regulator [Paenibacillus azoreducens]
MNLHALRFLVKVAETGSVTTAAETLRVSQPAVTAQIKRLEQELGIQLWLPQGRGVALTDTGRMLALEAQKLFDLEHAIEERLDIIKLGKAGKLHIAATYLPANFLLPGPIADYKKSHPAVELDLTTTNSSHALDLLLHYKAEIAVIGGIHQEHPLLTKTPLLEDEMYFVVHPEHPLAGKDIPLADMLQEPFIYREEGSFSREQLLALCKIHHLPAPAIGLQMNGLHETIRVVMEGYGAAFLSALESEAFISEKRLAKVHVRDVKLKNPISVYSRKDPLSPAAELFRNLLINKKF